MQEENRGISYFTVFSWILVVWFYFWAVQRIWQALESIDTPEAWKPFELMFESGIVVFMLVVCALFTLGYGVFVYWLTKNSFKMNESEIKVDEDGVIEAERL